MEEPCFNTIQSPVPADARYLLKYKLFRRILVADTEMRQEGLEYLTSILKEMVINDPELLEDYFPTIIRLSAESPFVDVRQVLGKLVKDVTMSLEWLSSFRLPDISTFFSNDLVIPVDTDDAVVQDNFQRSFFQRGRVSHVERVLAWHKSYLQLYKRAWDAIMLEDGPLPITWRNYIAIMASASHSCAYCVTSEETVFLQNGGDPNWLRGLEYAPKKLQNLADLNIMLARRPWLINESHTKALLSGDNAWSLTELVHALVIICHFHAQSSLVLGMGITPEVDIANIEEEDEFESDSDDSEDMSSERDESILRQRLFEAQNDREKLIEKMEPLCDWGTGDEASQYMSSPKSLKRVRKPQVNMDKYCGDLVLEHEDFDVKSTEYHMFHTEDFCWEDHGFALVNRFLPGLAPRLDEQFRLIQKLTYNKYSSDTTGIDTSPYRSAIWAYVLRIMGVCKDDYNYREVNIFLNRPTKHYVKKVTFYPDRIRRNDFEHFDHVLTVEEKCHVNLLSIEAKKEAQLLYGLSAITRSMNR